MLGTWDTGSCMLLARSPSAHTAVQLGCVSFLWSPKYGGRRASCDPHPTSFTASKQLMNLRSAQSHTPCVGTLWASGLISLLCAQAWTPALKREHCAVDTHSHGDPSTSMVDYQALKWEHRVDRELAAGGGRRVEEQEDTEGREDGHLQTGKSFLHG